MNKIGWCDCCINPLSGCLHGCEYCYARSFAKRLAGRYGYPLDDPFRPTFHHDKVEAIYNLPGKGKRVFLDSMGDWFSPGVEADWIETVMDAVRCKPEHTFLVLTKRPAWIASYLAIEDIPDNLWIGTSITCKADNRRLVDLCRGLEGVHKFVSFEPLLGPVGRPQLYEMGIEWVIIGAETGNRAAKVIPKEEWVKEIFLSWPEDKHFPVFMKDNLAPHLPDWVLIKDIPWSMKR